MKLHLKDNIFAGCAAQPWASLTKPMSKLWYVEGTGTLHSFARLEIEIQLE